MHHRALFSLYTEQVLQWQLGPASADGAAQSASSPAVAEDLAQAQTTAERLLRALTRPPLRALNDPLLRPQPTQLLLLGLGDGTLASLLAEQLPPGCELLVLDDKPQRLRQVMGHRPTLFSGAHSPLLAVDSSPWALLMLCRAAGFDAEHCALCYNPAYKQQQSAAGLSPLEQWRRLFLGSHLLNSLAKAPTEPIAKLSLACIAHPEEELLADFLAQVPPWVAEVVVLWDSVAPTSLPPCAVPVRCHTRSLNGDFAAQRNALLSLCRGEWCLYLDVDEALSPQTWAALPNWMALRVDGHKAGAIVLPRETFMNGTEAVRMGYGLWPDVQVRLFPLHQPEVHFEGAVHERLTGLRGPLLLAGGHALLHYSHARKSRAKLAARLQVFDQAAGQPRHVLSKAYPCLPVDFFAQIRQRFGSHTLLQLPPALQM